MAKINLKNLLEKMPSYARITYANQELSDQKDEEGFPIPKRTAVVISFSMPGFGFGELLFVEENGQLCLDTEHTSKKTVMEILDKLVDSAIWDTELDPTRHEIYNRIRRSECGPNCPVCSASQEEESS